MLRPLCVLLLWAGATWAGGGPETTLVVVNGESPVSRRVALEYLHLRGIPANHLVRVTGMPHLGVVPLDLFLERVWTSIREHLEREGLSDRIDLIVYSADLPYAVDFRARVKGGPTPDPGRHASWTGITYLIRHVLEENPFYDLGINRYYRLAPGGGAEQRQATAEERGHAMRAAQALQRRRYAEAAKAYEALLETYSAAPLAWYNYACCLARLGRTEDALEALERAAETGFRNAQHAANDPDLAPLRSLPGFRAVVERMGGGGADILVKPSHGFRAAYSWTGEEAPVLDPGSDSADRYFLSTRLGYTGRYGNSLAEVLAALRRSASVDGTRPDGTVYLCRNGNVRSTTREPFFAKTVEELRRRGRRVETLANDDEGQTGVLPVGKQDVIGAVIGSAGFRWESSRSAMLPGAICEHLTSFGAHFGTAGQTKLSELVRYGAAGSSGTVQEPYALHPKFPNPMIHVFYADGCSLAEAFFQSVWGPYQLMVVGDGLARPFATFVEVKVDAPAQPWKGTFEIAAAAGGAGRFELWLDGRFVAEAAPGAPLPLDTSSLDDGHHEVRVAAVAGDSVETRSVALLPARVDNAGRKATVKAATGAVSLNAEIAVAIKAPGATEFQLLHGALVVASSADGKLAVAASRVGPGPVALVPRAIFPNGPAWRGAPLRFDIEAPLCAAEQAEPLEPFHAGLRGRLEAPGKPTRPLVVTHVGDRHGGRLLRDQLPADSDGELTLEGWLEIREPGFFQLLANGTGRLTLTCAGIPLCEDRELKGPLYLPVALERGWHPIALRLHGDGRPQLELMLGGDQVLDAPRLVHRPGPAPKRAPQSADAHAPLLDGNRADKGLLLSTAGVELKWKSTQKDVASVVVYPGTDARSFPTEWTVEATSGYGKPKPVKDLAIAIAPAPKAPGKDQPDLPAYVLLTFEPQRVRKLVVRPKDKAVVAELVVACE